MERRKEQRIKEEATGQYSSTGQQTDFDPSPYSEVGISNPDSCDPFMAEIAMSTQKEEMQKIFWIVGYFLWFFLLPWALLRLIFWIKTVGDITKV